MSDPFNDPQYPKSDPQNPYTSPHGEGKPEFGGFSKSELTWASGMHLSGLVATLLGAGICGFVGPLILWLIKRHDSVFLDDQGKEALNFQLTMVVWWVVVGAIGIATCGFGFVLAPVPLVMQIVFSVIAAIKANDGIEYRYPLTIRFI